ALKRELKGDHDGAARWLALVRQVGGVSEGPVARLLEKTSEPEGVKLAAAALSLSAKGDAPETALGVLEPAFRAEQKPKRREMLRMSLASAYLTYDRPAPLLELSDDFRRTEDDELADIFRYHALMKLERFDDA